MNIRLNTIAMPYPKIELGEIMKNTIKKIHAGKPDSKDEVNFKGISEFMKSSIVPGNCEKVVSLVNVGTYNICCNNVK